MKLLTRLTATLGARATRAVARSSARFGIRSGTDAGAHSASRVADPVTLLAATGAADAADGADATTAPVVTRVATSGPTAVVDSAKRPDSIADAAVRAARQAVTTARVRHDRLRRTGDTRRAHLATLVEGDARWTRRAVSSAAHDEAEALACLERRHALRGRIDDARQALDAHERLERETRARLEALETRLADIVRRRDALRSRASLERTGDALDTVSRDDPTSLADLFERWEIRIADTDPLDRVTGTSSDIGVGPAADPRERKDGNTERDAMLRAELADLIGETRPVAELETSRD